MPSFTITERNARIAVKVLKWVHPDCGPQWMLPNLTYMHLPNFIEDHSTGMMLIETIWSKGYLITFQGRECVIKTAHETGPDKPPFKLYGFGSANTPHAALIAAIEEMIKEEE